MEIHLDIIKPRHTLKEQWTYLLQRGHDRDRYRINKILLALVLVTVSYFVFYFLTGANDFITLKVVSGFMFALFWIVFFIVWLIFKIQILINNKKLNKFLESITDEQLKYSVQIDEEKVVISLTSQSYVIPWKELTQYGIHNNTIYVFNEVETMNSLYWHQTEMGNEAFTSLHQLIQKKSINQVF